MVPWTTVPFLSSMVTVSLFSFIKNLQRNPKSSTELGEVRTERRSEGKGKGGAIRARGERERGRYLTSFISPVLAEGRRRREAAAAELKRGGSRRSYAVGFLGAGGVNPSLKADLADGWGWEAVRSGLVGPFLGHLYRAWLESLLFL